MTEHSFARRDVIKAAGAGLATSLLAAATAEAQTQAAAQTAAEFWTAEYAAKKGDVSLAIYRKRVGAPAAGGAQKPVLFLVHGSSNAALSSYDLAVPGNAEYSMMNVFARLGYDVWTMDHEGYGKSSRTAGNSDIASGVEDLKAAIPIVVKETGRGQVPFLRHFLGWHSRRRRSRRRSPIRSTGWCLPRSPTRAKTRRPSRSAPSSSNTTRPTTRACATAP